MRQQDSLRKFGPVWGASGVQGFFGEGYPYHKYARLLGLDFRKLTFVAKTATANYNRGNMPLKNDGTTPVEVFPGCVYVSLRSFFHGSALNAVGLSNFGIKFLVEERRWQKRTEPFFISVMALQSEPEKVCEETTIFFKHIGAMLQSHPALKDILGLQINISCPNTGHDMQALLTRVVWFAKAQLGAFSPFGIPLVPKINLLLPIEAALEIGNDPNCAGLTLSNTIPWNNLERFCIDRKKIFGSDESPLIKRGFKQTGGYSGKHMLPWVAKYVRDLRRAGFRKHINAGGGILAPDDVNLLQNVGATSVSLGSISFLRPWKMRETINRAYEF